MARAQAQARSYRPVESEYKSPRYNPAQSGATRDMVAYDPADSFMQALLKWRGTLLPMVLLKPFFWALMLFVLVLIFVHRHLIQERGFGLPTLEWAAVLMPSSLLTFFIVFYGQQSYTRYYQLYSHCIGMVRAAPLASRRARPRPLSPPNRAARPAG